MTKARRQVAPRVNTFPPETAFERVSVGRRDISVYGVRLDVPAALVTFALYRRPNSHNAVRRVAHTRGVKFGRATCLGDVPSPASEAKIADS